MRQHQSFNCLIALLFISINVFSQQIDSVQFGPVIDQKSQILSFVHVANNEVVALSKKSDNLYLEWYDDATLTKKQQVKIEFPENEEYYLKLDAIISLNGHLKLIASGYSTLKENFGMFVYDVYSDGKIDPKCAFQIVPGIKELSSDVPLEVRLSEDRSRCLLVKELSFRANNERKLQFLIVNENSGFIASQLIDFPKPASKKNIQSTYFELVGNEDVYAMVVSTNYQKQARSFMSELQLLHFTAAENSVLDEKRITFPKGVVPINPELLSNQILVGNYLTFNGKNINGIGGVFHVNTDSIAFGKNVVLQRYGNEVRNKTLKGREATNQTDVPNVYVHQQTLKDSIGNVYLISERHTVKDMGMSIKEYYFGSIIVSKLDANGKVIWEKFLPKSQFFQEKAVPVFIPGLPFSPVFMFKYRLDDVQFLSYKTWIQNNQLHFAFLDHEENETKTPKEERKNLTKIKDAVPFVIQITEKGDVTYTMKKEWANAKLSPAFANALFRNGCLYTINSGKEDQQLSKIRLGY